MAATPMATPAGPDLATAMVPLDGTDPTLPLDDLEALRGIVGDARIVGLGEPTHGQREVFQLKHRIIEYLVAELRFTTFALEASVVGCRDMSRFVLTGEGDPDAAVKAQGFWTWSTEEVLELVLWLREWNIAHPAQLVDVAGIDTQEAKSAYRELITLLSNHDSQLVIDYASDLAGIASIQLGFTPYDADQHRTYTAALDTVEERISALPEISDEEIILALDNVLAIRQFLTLWAAPDDLARSTARDRVMADRTAALANTTPTSRVALWAHNAHIATSQGAYWGEIVVPMGLNLKARFVDDYVIIGIFFGAGEYQGIRKEGPRPYELTSDDVGPPPAGSLDAALFDASPAPVSLLDLRDLPDELHAWIASPRVTRQAGALLVDSEKMTMKMNVVQAFDVIAFVRETTPAVPL